MLLDDAGGRVGQRIRTGRLVAGHRQPVHRAEAADEVDVGDVEPPEREVVEVHPVHRVRVAREVGVAGERPLVRLEARGPRP